MICRKKELVSWQRFPRALVKICVYLLIPGKSETRPKAKPFMQMSPHVLQPMEDALSHKLMTQIIQRFQMQANSWYLLGCGVLNPL